jgi:hypothetical protein
LQKTWDVAARALEHANVAQKQLYRLAVRGNRVRGMARL